MPTKKTPEFNYKSKRQFWQAYQHTVKAFEHAAACRAQVRKLPDPDPEVFRAYDEMVTRHWTTINQMKRVCRLMFNCKIEALEVYK